jgi:hypothetical protein
MSPTRLSKKLVRHLRLKESWVIFFILGLIMLNYPFMQIFNKVDPFLGFPLLYLYLQAGWAISIFVIYLFTKAIPPQNDNDDKDES